MGCCMFERFTEEAREAMALSNAELKHYGHEVIGTGHILLGLVEEGSGAGGAVLKKFGVGLTEVRKEFERLLEQRLEKDVSDKLPSTSLAKKVIENAIEEARALNHSYIGTEHLLLGLVREKEGIGAQILMNLGLKLDVVRQEILDLPSLGG